MALVTVFLRVAGYWIVGRFPLTTRLRRGLEALPLALFAATIIPLAVKGGPAGWIAVPIVEVAMLLTGKEAIALLAGIGAASLAARLRPVNARVTFLVVVSILAFTANPLLARLAVVTREMDALGYTGVRLASGALVLLLIILVQHWRANGAPLRIAGAWAGAASLFVLRHHLFPSGSSSSARRWARVILFAAVQIAILAWAIFKGDRPGPLEWAGLALAFASLVYLVSPGLVAPDPLGSALMIVSGVAWAAYTLIGRGSRAPVEDTAGNFIRLLPISIPLIVAGLFVQTPTGLGLLYAIISGAISSGLGYAIWYAVSLDQPLAAPSCN